MNYKEAYDGAIAETLGIRGGKCLVSQIGFLPNNDVVISIKILLDFAQKQKLIKLHAEYMAKILYIAKILGEG